MSAASNGTIEWLQLAFEFTKIAAIVIGGFIALYEYRRFRRYGAKSQFDLDFDIFPLKELKEAYLLEIRMSIKNMGNIRQVFSIIEIWVNTSNIHDFTNFRIDELGSHIKLHSKKELRFSEKLIQKRNILEKAPDGYIFVDPGVLQILPYKVVVYNPGNFIEVVSRFFYKVSWIKYIILRIIVMMGLSEKWRDKKRIERLKNYKVDEFHMAAKIKQVDNKEY